MFIYIFFKSHHVLKFCPFLLTYYILRNLSFSRSIHILGVKKNQAESGDIDYIVVFFFFLFIFLIFFIGGEMIE
jgi:hypothetical protein